MKRIIWAVVLALMVAASSAKAESRYLRHPIFQNLPPMELRVETQFGYGDTGSLPFGVLGGFGIGVGDALTIGAYGQLFTSDRELPAKVSVVYGVGGFCEYAWTLGYPVEPYVGLRLGMLDPTGPGSPTVPYAGGIIGVKYPLTNVLTLTAALTFHWAGDSDDYEAYNYDSTGGADSSDMTFDAGLRYAF